MYQFLNDELLHLPFSKNLKIDPLKKSGLLCGMIWLSNNLFEISERHIVT